MHETKEKIKHLCTLKETLCDELKSQFGKGLQSIDTHEVGEVVDMIKDLTEAEEKCWKACYYKKIIEAMEEEVDDEEGRSGYNSRRYASGRYAPKGRGHISGYRPYPGFDEMWRDEFSEDPMMENLRMGYSGSRGSRSGGSNMSGGGSSYGGSMSGSRSGYGDGREKGSRYGQAYNDYQESKRHYTASNSPADKEEMERHANEHVSDTIATIREIYKTSDPDLKKRIKADMTKLIGEMPN